MFFDKIIPVSSAFDIEDRIKKEEGLDTAKSIRTKKVECGICHKIICHKSLLRHIELVHERIKPFQCETCASSFAEKRRLQEHIAFNHEGKTLYMCDTCKTSFHKRLI